MPTQSMALKTKQSPFVRAAIPVLVVPPGEFRSRKDRDVSLVSTTFISGQLLKPYETVQVAGRSIPGPEWVGNGDTAFLIYDEILLASCPPIQVRGQCISDVEFHIPFIFDITGLNTTDSRFLGVTIAVFPADPELKAAAEQNQRIQGTGLQLRLQSKLFKHWSTLPEAIEAAALLCQPQFLALALFPAQGIGIPTSLGIYTAEKHHLGSSVGRWIQDTIDNLATQDPGLAQLIGQGRAYAGRAIRELQETLEVSVRENDQRLFH